MASFVMVHMCCHYMWETGHFLTFIKGGVKVLVNYWLILRFNSEGHMRICFCQSIN